MIMLPLLINILKRKTDSKLFSVLGCLRFVYKKDFKEIVHKTCTQVVVQISFILFVLWVLTQKPRKHNLNFLTSSNLITNV